MKIKICGIRTAKEAGYINEAKADYSGCVFYEQSKRNVTFESAKEVLKALEPGIKKVAVKELSGAPQKGYDHSGIFTSLGFMDGNGVTELQIR